MSRLLLDLSLDFFPDLASGQIGVIFRKMDGNQTTSRDAQKELVKELGHGNIITSVSHTESQLVVIGIRDPKDFKKIGIDLESAHRVTHPRLLERLTLPDERKFGLSALEIWSIKEACFKAQPENTGTVLSQYYIRSYDENDGTGVIHGPGKSTIRFRLLHLSEWSIALAYSC